MQHKMSHELHSAHAMWCSHHHYLVPEHLLYPKRSFHTHEAVIPHLPSLSPMASITYSLYRLVYPGCFTQMESNNT